MILQRAVTEEDSSSTGEMLPRCCIDALYEQTEKMRFLKLEKSF